MREKFNKVLALTLSLALSTSIISPTFAAENNASQTSPVTLTAQPIVFNVGVPTGLPIDVDAQGNVIVATDAKITNNSAAPIMIAGVQVNPITDWNIVPMNKDFKSSKIGTKEFGFVLNSDEVPSSGAMTLTQANWPSVNGGSILPLSYDSIVAPQKDEIVGSKIADVVFTIGWDTNDTSDINYVMATDADFSGEADGSFKYIGTDEYVEIPHVIKGVPVTSYSFLFQNTSVKGVKSTNKNVTNMEGMFWESQAPTLDLSSLDTSNVTSMKYMFNSSLATSIIGLNRFDTSNLTDMSGLFHDSRVISINLSNFDTSNVTDMSTVFHNSRATSIVGLNRFETSNVTDMDSMFGGSQPTSLDLSSFNTSNVTSMNSMFARSQATTLDLSSFDTSNVTEMKWMFQNSQATTGYAKTQDDADKFNASSEKPSALTFVVK